jgi:UDP-glucuronate 4-epimerase
VLKRDRAERLECHDGFRLITGDIRAEADVRRLLDALVYASSGAVYGGTPALPFREDHAAAWPLSLYGATKRCDELLALTYAHGARLRCTGLRFSTVYGTDGRRDMAMYTFAERISRGDPIQVHAHGQMVRDFLWGDDAAHAVALAVEDTRRSPPRPSAVAGPDRSPSPPGGC